MPKRKVIININQVFGYLTVIEEAGKDKYFNYIYLCRCICGVEKKVRATNLLKGHDTSCGCKRGRWSRSSVYYNITIL